MSKDPTDEGLKQAFESSSASGRMADEDVSEETVQVVSFSLSEEWYGFRLTDLVEIIGGVAPTPIPFTPPFIPGVINHRGTVVAVVDLRKVFGLPARFRGSDGRTVLVSSDEIVVGFGADAISDVITIRSSQIEPPLSTIEKVKAEYIEGCVRLDQGLLVLLAADRLIHELRAHPGA